MWRGVEVINRTRGPDQLIRGRRVRAPRIGQGCGSFLQAIEIADAVLVRDGEHENLAPLFAMSDGEPANPRAGSSQGAGIGVCLLRSQQLPGSAQDPAQKFFWRGDGT